MKLLLKVKMGLVLMLISSLVQAYPTASEWQWQNPLPTGNPGYGLAYDGSTFILVGENQSIRRSSDGFSWSDETPLGSGTARDIIFASEQFVMVGDGGFISTSADGVSWFPRSSNLSAFNLNSVIFAAGKYVAVGTGGSVTTSSDGISWASSNVQNGPFFNDIVYNGSFYVAVGRNGVIYTSTDTSSWASEPSNVTTSLKSIAWNGSVFVAVGVSGTIISSTNGASWTQRTAPANTFEINDVIWDGSQFLAVASAGKIISSPDGVDWSNATSVSLLFGEGFNKILMTPAALTSGQYFIIGDAGTVISSTDLTSWFIRSPDASLTTQTIEDINWNGSEFIAIGSNIPILKSSDGISWNNVADNFDFFKSVTWDGSQYIAVGSGNSAWSSTDGVTWASHSLPASYTMNNIALSNTGALVAVGFNGKIISSNDNAASWSDRTSGVSDALYGLASSADITLAVGDNGTIISSSNNINWSQQNVSGLTGVSLQSITYGGPANFIAVGSAGTLISSDNGIDWSLSTLGGDMLSDVMWDGNQYIIVGERGSCYHSTDGINWQSCRTGTVNMLNAVAGNSSVVVSVGNFGSILSSRAVNEAPEPSVAAVITDEDSAVTAQVEANDPDLGDSVQFTIKTLPALGLSSIDFSSGLLRYTPNANVNGIDSLIVTASDSAGLSADLTVSITINAVNDAPTATAPAIAVDAGKTSTSQISVTDIDTDDSHTYTITSQPAQGTATVSSDGLLSYTANKGTSGADSITVQVADAAGATADVVVGVTITAVKSSGGGVLNLYSLLLLSAMIALMRRHGKGF